MRYVANALVAPAGGTLAVSRPSPLSACLAEARRFARTADASAVGHPATAELLGLAPSRAELTPTDGDIGLVVRLARRASAPGDVAVRPEDLVVQVVLHGWTSPLAPVMPHLVAAEILEQILEGDE